MVEVNNLINTINSIINNYRLSTNTYFNGNLVISKYIIYLTILVSISSL